MESPIAAILKHFEFKGNLLEIVSHKVGHIHDTYIATFQSQSGDTQRYIVQRVNHNVFRNPVKLMRNIEAVTAHLREK
ncbi:MAG: mucin desulfatase, partial [Chloroflexota bacterium]|nr:mucin desulfatase [Chloroflexota bacterium]